MLSLTDPILAASHHNAQTTDIMSRITSNPISDAFDDESEIDVANQTFPTPPQSENNPPPAKKRAGRPKSAVTASTGAKVTKAKTKRKSVEGARAKAGSKTGKRHALKEVSNKAPTDGNETEEVDDFESLSGDAPRDVPQLQQPTPRAEAQAPAKRGKKLKVEDSQIVPAAQDQMDEDKPKTKRTRKPAAPQTAVYEVPETQQDVLVTSRLAKTTTKNASKPPRPAKKEIPPALPEAAPAPLTDVERMDVDDSTVTDPADPDTFEQPARATAKAASRAPARAPSKQPARTNQAARQPSVDATPSIEPTLSRQLQDLTTKFEALQTKYTNLRALAVSEGESNFTKLQKASEEKTRAADALITSLKADVERERARADAAEAEAARVKVAEDLGKKAGEDNKTLSKTLAEAQNEIKALQARLSAARSTSQTVENTKGAAPGSAIKGPLSGRTILVGSAEAAKEAQKRVLKEELYSDLTGLILRDVKKGEEGEDVYDCIQTGRNGSEYSPRISGVELCR